MPGTAQGAAVLGGGVRGGGAGGRRRGRSSAGDSVGGGSTATAVRISARQRREGDPTPHQTHIHAQHGWFKAQVPGLTQY